MKDRITNQIDMIGACIALADKPEYIALWTGQQPADFESDLNTVRSEYGAIRSASSTAYASTTGAADAKAQAETGLEDAAYVLARACAAHFKRIGDLTRLAKVDFSKSAIVRLRDQALVTTATLIRDQANTARLETGAQNRGVTQARVTTLTNAITLFTSLINAPRGQIANRGALIRDVETRVGGLVSRMEDLDDLVLQFDATPQGRAFIAAWKQARIIVDGGHGPGEEEEGGGTPPPAPNP